jgi:hypothetical protein
VKGRGALPLDRGAVAAEARLEDAAIGELLPEE